MPTSKTTKRITRPAQSSARKGGSKKVVFILILIVLAIFAALYLVLSRNSSEPGREAPGNASGDTGELEEAAGGASQDARITMGKAKLQLESAGNKDVVRVVIDKAVGNNGEDIAYRFEWTLNGKPAGDGSDSLSGFKRGDRVSVKITPFEGEKAGPSKILDFLIQNTPPKVAESQGAKFDGKTFSYQVKGTDQDGDTLSYAIEEAPEGMTIDPQTGAIRWQLKENDYGERTIKVKVSDGKGGTTTHSVNVDLPKPAEEKKPGENRK